MTLHAPLTNGFHLDDTNETQTLSET